MKTQLKFWLIVVFAFFLINKIFALPDHSPDLSDIDWLIIARTAIANEEVTNRWENSLSEICKIEQNLFKARPYKKCTLL